MNKRSNIVKEKAYAFALHTIKFVRSLPKDVATYTLGSQLLRASTSIGANVEEAIGTDTKRDFTHKMGIAKREARESKYWLQLIIDSKLAKDETNLIQEVEELISILTSIVKTSQAKC